MKSTSFCFIFTNTKSLVLSPSTGLPPPSILLGRGAAHHVSFSFSFVSFCSWVLSAAP